MKAIPKKVKLMFASSLSCYSTASTMREARIYIEQTFLGYEPKTTVFPLKFEDVLDLESGLYYWAVILFFWTIILLVQWYRAGMPPDKLNVEEGMDVQLSNKTQKLLGSLFLIVCVIVISYILLLYFNYI